MKKILTLSLFLAAVTAGFSADPDYHRDVAPILRDYCAGCHNDFDLEGEFSVETFAAVSAGGESQDDSPILVPGDSQKSYLLQLLTKRGKGQMPPADETQPSEVEIAIIKSWIDAGAKGPKPENDKSILSTLNISRIAPNPDKTTTPVTAAEYSPDGKWIAVARFGSVTLKNADSGKTVREFPNLSGKVNAVHFSPDGATLVTASGITGLKGIATIWEISSGKKLAEIGEGVHRDILFDAEFSPDGKLLATAGYDRVIRIWNAADGKFVREIAGHNGAVFDLAFSPDGTLLASASADETGKIWRVEDGERLDTLNQPQGEQFRIAFTPNGRFVVGAGADNRIRLWRLLSKTKPRINPVIHARFAHEDAINDFAMSRDGKWLVTASSDDSVKLWSLPDLKQRKMFGDQPDLVSVLVFQPKGGAFQAARMDGTIQIYSIKDFLPRSRDPANSGLLVRKQTGAVRQPNPVDSITPAGEISKITETETENAQPVSLPAEIAGNIGTEGDVDRFQFSAKAGEEWVLEVNAARSKSMLDSRIEVLTAEGEPIERVVLQAVRDSWFTFRGKDSNTSDDFRVHNWREMELNELLYANGEVVKLWHYPRGPDSGFRVYPGFGNRRTYFDTTPISQPLGGPCYIVRALPAGSNPSPNGLPVYRVFYENDDDARRKLGKDSKLTFTAPADGNYLARITDVRGFGGEKFDYKLTIRPRKQDFTVSVGGKNARPSPGSGKELSFTATRMDDFEGPITIDITGLPKGFTASTPVTIEGGNDRAFAVLNASADLEPAPMEKVKGEDGKEKMQPKKIVAEGWDKVKVTATAKVNGKPVTKDLGHLGEIGVGVVPKVLITIMPDGESGTLGEDGVLEFEVEPGETVSAIVEVERREKFNGLVSFGKDESGRGMPHGMFVDNIGLNGLMIPEKKSKQRFFFTAAPIVPEQEAMFFLKTGADGNQASYPVRVKVVSEKGATAQN
ncbi:MAG: hypothetical protein HKN23_02090 [Verrucomicrobiales bacterium]|nr:hypothetical protein [Verrucomicrobiales bacterium]